MWIYTFSKKLDINPVQDARDTQGRGFQNDALCIYKDWML